MTKRYRARIVITLISLEGSGTPREELAANKVFSVAAVALTTEARRHADPGCCALEVSHTVQHARGQLWEALHVPLAESEAQT